MTWQPKTIIVGYDGTQPAELALEHAAELARAFEATVIVADVAPPSPLVAPGAFGLAPSYVGAADEIASADKALWQQHRARVESLLAGSGVTHEFSTAVGAPVEELVDVARRRKADLIVVGTRELGWLGRLLEGSVSEGVARRAPCDVLVVHPPPDEAEAQDGTSA